MKRLAIIACLAICACQPRARDMQVEKPGGGKLSLPISETLRINLNSEPPSIDWQIGGDTLSNLVIGNIMEGLMQFDLADKELGLKPALALKLESSEGARKWKITLRDDVKWSDGVPFTSQNVIDSWHRLLDRKTAAVDAYYLYPLKNGKDFNLGKKEWKDVGVKAIGPYQIEVELEKPMGYFPYLLTQHSVYPIRLDVIEKSGSQWTEPKNIVTLGPFKMIVWQHDKLIVLERNDLYYGDRPQIKYIAAHMIEEQSTELSLFAAGELDAVHSLPSVELKRLRKTKEFREKARLASYYYGMNISKPPMDKPLVRRAIAMAIDRKQIVQMLAGDELPLSSWVPAGMFGYEAERGLPFQPEKARELLKQAGYSNPAQVPKIELVFNTRDDHQRIAENIQAQLKKNLGLNLELKNEEWKVFLNKLHSDPPQLFRMGWQASYPDPDDFMELILSYSENNYTHWKNSKFDDLVLKAAGLVDREARSRLYSQAQKILVEEDVPVIPIYSSVNHILVASRVQNYPLNAMEVFNYKGVSLK